MDAFWALVTSFFFPIIVSFLTSWGFSSRYYRKANKGKRLSFIKDNSITLSISETTKEITQSKVNLKGCFRLKIFAKETEVGGGVAVELVPMTEKVLDECDKTLMVLTLRNIGEKNARIRGFVYSHAKSDHYIVLENNEVYDIEPGQKMPLYVSKSSYPCEIQVSYPDCSLFFPRIDGNPPPLRTPEVKELKQP